MGQFLIGHMEVRHSLVYYELLIIVYAVTMQESDNMSVMTIAIYAYISAGAIKRNRTSMTLCG